MAQYQQRTQPMHRGGGEAGTLAYGAKSVVGAAAAPAQQSYFRIQQQHAPLYTSQPITYSRDGYRGGGEYVRAVSNRISLLPPTYLPPPAPPPPPPADPPPFKKIRLTVEHQTSHQLRVDTRDQNYSSSEQLSPNPITDLTIEDQSFRTTKDDLLQQISKVDREMSVSELSLAKLKKKAEELEKSATRPQASAEPEAEVPRHRSLEQSIYLENRKKAREAHAVLEKLGLKNQWPLYNQPQDTDIYRENKVKHRAFRPRLLAYMRRRRAEKERRDEKLAEAYTKRLLDWRQRVERIESSQKRKAQDAKNREFFEKVFPELRKQREDRERFNRVGARVKSEADFEEIVDGLQEQEMEDKKMRSYAVVPPLLLESCARKASYRDTNGRCWDMEAEHRDLKHHNVWTPHERETFKEKYLQHPKNFVAISSYLERKCVRDCVRFYYLTKKTENYKQLLKRNRARPTKRGSGRGSELGGGVQTRQRARGGDKEPETAPDPSRAAEADPPTSEVPCPRTPPPVSSPATGAAPVGECSAAATPLGSAAVPSPPPSAPQQQQPPAVPSSPTPEANAPRTPTPGTAATAAVTSATTPPAVVTSTDVAIESETSVVTATATTSTASVVMSTASVASVAAAPLIVAAPTTASSIAKTSETRSEVDNIVTSIITASNLTCGVCNATVDTNARTVGRARAHHYGLSESAGQDARVCEGCHAACVRGRFARCPLVSCAGPRVRAKRLRLLPPRWHELPMHMKQPILDEFQISAELSKCCLACSKRIVKRMEAVAGPAPEPTDDEVSRFRVLLRDHGTDWAVMSQACSRPAAYLKAFYFTHRRRHALDTAGMTPHSDSSCGESGSPSPPPPPAAAPVPVAAAHHNDSSATETADEESESTTPTAQSAPQQQQQGQQPTAPVQQQVAPLQQQQQPAPPPTPTATITVREMLVKVIEGSFKPGNQLLSAQSTRPSMVAPRDSHVTLTVVDNAAAHHPAPRSPHRPATITPVPSPMPQPVQNDNADQESLLDLTVRKSRTAPFAPPSRPAPSSHPPRIYQTPPESYYGRQSFSNVKLPPAKGSITRGTPVSPEPEQQKVGSITAGTPVSDKRANINYDYYKRTSPSARYPRPAAYGHEQRHIIMVDYMTSKQMPNVGARGVIQRGPGGGCEALKSLVEVAVQQPSLPVPPPTRLDKQSPHAQSPHAQSPHAPSPHAQSPHVSSHASPHVSSHTSPHVSSHTSPHVSSHASPHGSSHTSSHVSSHNSPHVSSHTSPHAQQEHYQERLQRDYAYKYHQQQIQMQAIESHRRAQMVAATQIQQGREREQQQRALAAKRQHIAAMEHQQLIDRHHNTMQQHVQVTSGGGGGVAQAEDARRYAQPARVVGKETPLPQPQPNIRGPTTREGTLTAASLIDAIIHHQITQTSCEPPPPTRQFSYVRDPASGSANPGGSNVNVTQSVTVSAPSVNNVTEPNVVTAPSNDESLHTTSFKLGDLASNIITRDFTSSSLLQVRHNDIQRRFPTENAYATSNPGDEWKRNREAPPAPKHPSYMLEPVSPPDNRPNSRPPPVSNVPAATSSSSGSVRGYGTTNANNRNLNAFDFVATRIVEAMRSDTKENTGFTYYPYSALTVPVGEAPPPAPAPAPASHPPPPPEPAPLMSAQYEPLSDED